MNMKLAAAGLLCALMTACGGSGEESTTAPNGVPETLAISAEGRWTGKVGADTLAVNVLENGEIWGFYARNTGVARNLYGRVTTEGSSLKGTLTDVNLRNGEPNSFDFTGKITPNASLDLTMLQEKSISLQYDARYEQAADAASLVGDYQGKSFHVRSRTQAEGSGRSTFSSVSSHSAALNVSNSGEAVFSLSSQCSMTGTLRPRPSGKNIFDASMTYQGSACPEDDGTPTHGIAMFVSDTNTLLVQTLNEGKTAGFSISAVRQK